MKSSRRFFAALFAAAALLFSHGGAHADDPLCLNWASGAGPVVDGSIASDTGYMLANQYAFNNGTSQPDAVVQIVRGTKLSFSIEVNNDPEFNKGDLIVLLIGPDPNDATKDRRIHIKPVSDSGGNATPGTGSLNLPFRVEAWRNSTTWMNNIANPEVDPPWIDAKVTASGSGPVSYRVEVGIDTSTSGMPFATGANSFKLHINILRLYRSTSDGITDTYVAGELNWPSNAHIPGLPSNPTDTQLFSNPGRNVWGDVLLGVSSSECSGVRVTRAWLNGNEANTSRLTPPPQLGVDATNTYHVEIENAGPANAGNILATLRSWVFGISPLGVFAQIPANPNPIESYSTATPGPIAGNSTRTLDPASWTVDYNTYRNLLGLSANVCSLIQLDVDNSHTAGVSRTLISSRIFPWNTHFDGSSTFRHTAALTTKGFEKPAGGAREQRFHLVVSTREVNAKGDDRGTRSDKRFARVAYKDVAGEIRLAGATKFYETGAALMSKIVCGYRHTGTYMRLDGKDVAMMERTPCYGYWIYHRGPFAEWTDVLSGRGLKQMKANMYSISVPMEKSVALETVITAKGAKPNCGCTKGDDSCLKMCRDRPGK